MKSQSFITRHLYLEITIIFTKTVHYGHNQNAIFCRAVCIKNSLHVFPRIAPDDLNTRLERERQRQRGEDKSAKNAIAHDIIKVGRESK
jgi:hypothetical protein